MRYLLIDTDTASDDAVALLLALGWSGVEVVAVTTVAGNVPLDQATANALYTLQVAGRGGQVPVYPGCARPLLRPLRTCLEVHGPDGLGGCRFPPARQQPEVEHGAAALCRLAAEYAGALEVLALGPLTNVAVACQLDPALPRKVRRLYAMGGTAGGPGNVTPAAEYNFYADPEAAQAVLQAGFDLVLVPWDACREAATLGPRQLGAVAQLGTPRARFALAVTRCALAWGLAHGQGGLCLPDALAAAVALDPSLVRRAAPARVAVECAGSFTRGYCWVQWVDAPGAAKEGPNAQVVLAADGERFWQALLALLTREC